MKHDDTQQREITLGMTRAAIDEAIERLGTAAELARTLEVDDAQIANWRSGKNPCAAGYYALMLTIAGTPFPEASAAALLTMNAHKKLGATLQRAARAWASTVRNP